ncbi:MAG: Gfo/Idh/MocA family oxidoreductase [Anaerolineae bacterium]|nr:Gfo/Idh/MocA family oxidoreductase [Anaerolineae bacterium]
MTQKTFRVAIIGTGMIAHSAHIPAWKAQKDAVELVAAADILPERVAKMGTEHDIPHIYTDWQKMLDEEQPDIVSVCTPNVYHKAPTIAALNSGAHVLCEKPITISTADAEEMYAAAESAGKQLIITQTTRFSNRAFAAKAYADSGRLGEMYYAETAWFRRRGIPTWGVFHMKEHNAGGPIYDLGVHMLDLLIWVMGNPKISAVSGMTATKFGNIDENLATSLADSGAPAGTLTPRPYDYHEYDVEDFAVGFLRLQNGASIVLRTSWAANVPENANTTFILGTQGGLQLRPDFEMISNIGALQANTTFKVPADAKVSFSGHFACMAHALRVFRGEEESVVKRAEVLNVMRALEGLYQSAEEGREIQLDA